MKENEFYIFTKFINLLFNEFSKFKTIKIADAKKSLRNLKQQDPQLYNIKKIYNVDVVYSKLCQKPFQRHGRSTSGWG